jgi:hypothetical protein
MCIQGAKYVIGMHLQAILTRVRFDLDEPCFVFENLIPSSETNKMKPGRFFMTPYRTKKGHDLWHFCSNCPDYPQSEFDELEMKPDSGSLCEECKSRESVGTCS